MGQTTLSVGPTGVPGADPGWRYDAFISYRHVEPDRRWARWLHRTLETYRVPSKLARTHNLPRRLRRVFRDEEELAASADLSGAIDEALSRSRFLIVVCSPRTPESEWVNQEVVRFREMGRDDRVLALLIEGEPRDAFPRALREIRRTLTDSQGMRHEEIERVEPLAADVRPGPSGGKGHMVRMAKLRLLASVLGVRFDDLRQREQDRRLRRLTAAGFFLLCLLLLMSALTAFAVHKTRQAREAEHQARTAEAEAGRQRDRSRQLLLRSYAAQGWHLAEAGGPGRAMLWFLRIVEIAEGAGSDGGAAVGNAPDESGARFARTCIATFFRSMPSELPDGVEPGQPTLLMNAGGVSRGIVPGRDFEVKIQDPTDRSFVCGPLRHSGPITHGESSADGTRVITTSADGTAQVWSAREGHPVGPPLVHGGRAVHGSLNDDGTRAVTAGGAFAKVWDVETGKAVAELPHPGRVSSAALDPSGGRVVTAITGEEALFLWDVGSAEPGTPLVPLTVRNAGLDAASVAFAPGADSILVADRAGIVRQWDPTSSRLLMQMRIGRGLDYVGFSADGALLTAIDCEGHQLVWQWRRRNDFRGGQRTDNAVAADASTVPAAAGSACGAEPPPGREKSLATSATGNVLVTSPEGVLGVLSSADFVNWQKERDESNLANLKRSAAYATAMKKWKDEVDSLEQVLKETVSPREVVRRELGEKTGHNPDVEDVEKEWKRRDDKLKERQKAAADRIDVLNRARPVWADEHSQGPRFAKTRFTVPRVEKVACGAFSSDGAVAAAGSRDGVTRVWRVADGSAVCGPLDCGGAVLAVTFDPGGRRLATVTAKTIQAWDLWAGLPLTPPLRCERAVSAEFHESGDVLVAVSGSGAEEVWKLQPDPRPLEALRASVNAFAAAQLDVDGGIVELSQRMPTPRFARFRPGAGAVPRPPAGPPPTLYDRLGGEPAVTAVIDDFLAYAAADPAVNFTRTDTPHEWAETPGNVANLKKHLVQFVSKATGGPSTYEGKTMLEVHTGMQITEAQWGAIVADLKKALEKNGVNDSREDEVIAVVAITHDQIVGR